MKWYMQKWVWLICLTLILAGLGFALALLDKVTGPQALTFFGGPLIGVLVGYVAGKADAPKVLK